MLIVHNSVMRIRKLTAAILMRCTPQEKTDLEQAVKVLSESDPEIDVSKWMRSVLRKEAKRILREHTRSVALAGKETSERTRKDDDAETPRKDKTPS